MKTWNKLTQINTKFKIKRKRKKEIYKIKLFLKMY